MGQCPSFYNYDRMNCSHQRKQGPVLGPAQGAGLSKGLVNFLAKINITNCVLTFPTALFTPNNLVLKILQTIP